MKQVESRLLIEELKTDGHSPMKFICSDGKVYYVKYRSGKSMDKAEINCLVFEMVCTKLLQNLLIPVPEHALVTINENSYAPGQLVTNKRFIKEGVVAWGSMEILQADFVKEIEQVSNKSEFNKLKNPEDLIRIAIFDLWVDNVDRHFGNYNLLLQLEESKLKFIAIDHAFSFGGLKGMNIFNVTTIPSYNKKLVESPYFRSIVKHFNNKERLEIAKQFISLLTKLDIEKIINETFTTIPAQWGISPKLEKRVIEFLKSKQRIALLRAICALQLQ